MVTRVRSYRLIIGISCATAVAVWSLATFVAGVVWILRDSKYLNDVMIPSLLLIAVLCGASVIVARRLWARYRQTQPAPS
jgi:uncharacterized membrane protein